MRSTRRNFQRWAYLSLHNLGRVQRTLMHPTLHWISITANSVLKECSYTASSTYQLHFSLHCVKQRKVWPKSVIHIILRTYGKTAYSNCGFHHVASQGLIMSETSSYLFYEAATSIRVKCINATIPMPLCSLYTRYSLLHCGPKIALFLFFQ